MGAKRAEHSQGGDGCCGRILQAATSQKGIRPTDFKVREVTRELEKLVQVQGVTEYTRDIDREVIQFF